MKLTPPPPTGIGILDRWLALLWRLLTADGQIGWSQVDKTGSVIGDLGDVTVTAPTNGQRMTYENGQWVNAGPTAAAQRAFAARHG